MMQEVCKHAVLNQRLPHRAGQYSSCMGTRHTVCSLVKRNISQAGDIPLRTQMQAAAIIDWLIFSKESLCLLSPGPFAVETHAAAMHGPYLNAEKDGQHIGKAEKS